MRMICNSKDELVDVSGSGPSNFVALSEQVELVSKAPAGVVLRWQVDAVLLA